MKYQHIVGEVFGKPWAMLPEKLAIISALVRLRASGLKLSEEEIRARLDAAELTAGSRNGPQSIGSVAVLPIYGVITNRANLFSAISGGTSVEGLKNKFRGAMADASVKAIVFDVDSPGGGVEGIDELAQEIYDSRKKKKIVAVANTMAASAAYWLASAAGELVVAPSGAVGSIGVFAAHEDLSKQNEQEGVKTSLISAGKYKVEGNPYEPLSEEARAAIQSKVDTFYGMFVKSVARGRGASQGDVREGFGQGRMVLAQDAVKQGMADRVATFDQVLQKLGVAGAPTPTMAAQAPALPVRADDDAPDPMADNVCGCDCQACKAGNCESCSVSSCADPGCYGAGCPNQASARATAASADLERRRRELDLL